MAEQSFELLKKHYGFLRMKYIGIDRCNLENKLKMIGLNVKKVVHKMLEILIERTYKKIPSFFTGISPSNNHIFLIYWAKK